jgi:hypothetical protein
MLYYIVKNILKVYKNYKEYLENGKSMYPALKKLQQLEKETQQKHKNISEKEAAAKSALAAAKKLEEQAILFEKELNSNKIQFEKEKSELLLSLNEKIKSNEILSEELNNQKKIYEEMQFELSEEAKEAKIVIKEAIRQAKHNIRETLDNFDELDEKYCEGTFQGFSIPISIIENSFEELKSHYQQIKDHIEANKVLPESINKWLDAIDIYIIKADNSLKSWDFPEAYNNILFGLSTCKNYELLLIILNEWGGNGNNDEGAENNDFIDWYDILDVDPNATSKEIKKRYKEMVKKYHPDTAPEEKKEEFNQTFILIGRAYEILSDPEKRRIFDEERRNHRR